MTRAADLAKLIAGGAVFNEASNDVDFRVESDGNANALIVDGEHSTVGINTAAVSNRTLKIEGEGNLGAILSLNESTRGGLVEFSAGSGTELYVGSELGILGSGNNNELLIYTGVSALKIDRSGNSTFANTVTLSDGNVVLANGHGIDFSATSDASGQSSELLDDYEEGTWTPSIVASSSESGQSYSTQIGTYVKIGRMVHAKFRVVLSAEGTFNGTYLLITGLPYTAASSPPATHLNNCYFVNIGVNVYSVGLQLYENDNKMYLWAVKDANTSRAYLANTDLTSTTELGASIVYQTA